MKNEKRIIFSTDMIKAIKNTKPGVWPAEPVDPEKPFKSMTRRIVKPQPILLRKGDGDSLDMWGWDCAKGMEEHWTEVSFARKELWQYAPYKAGDRLWVREKFQIYPIQEFFSKGGEMKPYEKIPKQKPESYYIEYAAGQKNQRKWRSPLFMPRWASRLLLEVKSVRIERVQDISEEDASAEGFGKRFLVDWLKDFSMEYPYWNYWDNGKRYWCKKHYEKGLRNFRKEVMAGEVPYGMEGLSKKRIREELSHYMSELVEEESPIFCDVCGKPLSFSALPSILEELSEYLDGRLSESEAPMLESLMCNCEDELFAKDNINRLLFSGLWNSINAKRGYSWENNPWVWVYEFMRLQ